MGKGDYHGASHIYASRAGTSPVPNTGSSILNLAARRKRTSCCAGCAARS